MPRRLLLALLALPLLGLGTAHADDTVRWRLARSDFLRYERTHFKRRKGTEKKQGTKIVTVHGHDLRDEGQYSCASPLHGDLFQYLAFRLPAPGAKKTSIKLDWKGGNTSAVRVKGSVSVSEFGARLVKIEGTYAFKSRGKAGREDRYWYDDGKARTSIEFDLKEGVIRSSRLEIVYEREDLKKNGPGSVLDFDEAYELSLQAIERRKPEDFQKRVTAAIEKGVAHLKSQQREDGSWKPHGNYRLGTTALAVFTLLACGVPAEDPTVKRPLDWIFTQDPERTYEQATCLMAIDRAYMPADEVKCLLTGAPILEFKRALPPKRMAWVRRVAERLEKNAVGGGGSWGYPSASNSALRFDTSNTQYAVLGLRAAGHMGYKTDERTWLGVVRHCKEVQERKGPKGAVSLIRPGTAIPDEASSHRMGIETTPKVAGFAYSVVDGHDHVSSSMTCAGITMLLVARHELRGMESRKFAGKLEKEVAAMLRGGWAWLDVHWAMDRNPKHPTHNWYWYFLYSLERAAVLDDIKRVGGKDWYFEGAMQLLHRQGTKGDWNSPGGDATAPTCFSLLFLKRGTTPLGGTVTGDK
ncbi:MAG: hypothetical protein P1V36_10045 [Planctomycetota bacterium]|nr:hypothetical protein [Planctomycetota bacterium]